MAPMTAKSVCHCLQRLLNCRTANKHCFLEASTHAACSGTRLLLFLLAILVASPAYADVIVLANRTPAQVAFRFIPKSGAAQQLTLPTGETLPLFLDGK